VARLQKLPGWVISNQESVRREAAPYRTMSPERRLALGAVAARSVMKLAFLAADRDTVLGYRDPLPESSRRALERLRARRRAADP
jgi:hypothetical protein